MTNNPEVSPATIFALLVLISGTAFGQTAPKPKKMPLYRTVMTCPKGQTLYVRQQTGMKGVPGEPYLVEMILEWRAWDGYSELFEDSKVSTPTCFKGNPPANGGRP